MLCFLLACAPLIVDFEDPGDSGVLEGELPEGQWSLDEPDDGFGWALHWDGVRLYMSAPGAGKLASVAGQGQLVVEDIPLGAGTSLHSHQGALFTSQSFTGDGQGLLPDGELGQGAAGRAQLSIGERWVLLDGQGIWEDGEHLELGVWGSAVVAHQGAWVIGASQGSPALRTEGGLDIERPASLDEAGAAMSSCDVDGDGVAELAVGAPGAGLVYLYTDLNQAPLAYGPGEGRFGQALSCGEAGLYVGAPMAREGEGAVFHLTGELLSAEPQEIYAGAGHAGNTLLAVEDALFVAETGGTAGEPGLVVRLF